MDVPPALFQGRIFRVKQAVQVTADGKRHLREVVRHPGAVAIVPLLDDGQDAMEMVRRGEIRDAKTMLGLLYYQLFRL
jgi:ADP-ribose pyrophosphatase